MFLRSVPGVNTVISVDGDVTAGGNASEGWRRTVPVGSALKLVRAALRFWRLADGSQIRYHAQLTAIVTSTTTMRDSSKPERPALVFRVDAPGDPVRWKRWRQANARPGANQTQTSTGVRGTGSA
jgi:hypothetical protein